MQPIQPLEKDDHGVLRFKKNAVVSYLLDNGGIDMNDLAVAATRHRWPREDQEQFAQLIGYSLSGFGDLSYVRDDTYEAASRMADGVDEKDARIAALSEKLESIRGVMRSAAAQLFGVHADDLKG